MASSSFAAASELLRGVGGFPSSIPIEEIFLTSLPHQWRDFQRSRPPSKIILIGHGDRGTHPPCTQVRESFAAGSPVSELVLDNGVRVFYDFLRKVVIALEREGAARWSYGFCWVDDDGFYFSPVLPGGIKEEFVRREFEEQGAGNVVLKTVQQCHIREARVAPFLAMPEVRVFGWYGATAADVDAVADGGSFATNWHLIGEERAHGRGVHLSARDKMMLSAHLSLKDTKGAPASVLFCALEPGRPEIVPAGSSQSEASSSLFDTGVYAIAQSGGTKSRTHWCVFWETSERTRLLPLYKLSFSPVSHPKKMLKWL